jgi:hypothetical protein
MLGGIAYPDSIRTFLVTKLTSSPAIALFIRFEEPLSARRLPSTVLRLPLLLHVSGFYAYSHPRPVHTTSTALKIGTLNPYH